ncbi:hypothetical protein V5O48_008317 [Marasmius crinis-equi]|uniref:Uncharacterized protein n=1 Tax=Marasmius crinis-equi TaxID=585013 RepID=A0ABR3FEP5_9AGAR
MTSDRRRRRTRTDGNAPRQLPPIASTSSFNWWPYPPFGASTSSAPLAAIATATTTVQPPQPTMPTATVAASSSSLVSSSLVSSTSFQSIATSTTLPTSAFSDNTTMVTITGTRGSQLATSSESFTEYPKVHPGSHNVNLNIILIVVFAVVGVLVGGIIAWFAYGCFTRKPGRRRRRSELEVGPAYCPPSPSSKVSREEYLQEKMSLRGGFEQDGDGHSWHVLDIQDDQLPSERTAFLDSDTQTLKSEFLAPLPYIRKPATASRSLYRAKTGASISVYSQVDHDDYEDIDTASFMGPDTFDPRSPRVVPSKTPTKKQSLNPDAIRRVPTTGTTTTMPTSDERTVSLSRRRPTCTRNDSSSLTDDSRSGSRDRDGDLSRTNTTKTTNTTRTTNTIKTTSTGRTGASTAMGFRILEESPLSTPLHRSPTSSEGFSWAGVGDMIWGSGQSADRYTNLPERGRSPAKKKSTGTTRTNRTRSKSVASASNEGGKVGGEDRERRLRDYYGYTAASGSHHMLPKSPPRITSPKLEGDLCFSPIIGQGQGRY